jgi:hypothetical protein
MLPEHLIQIIGFYEPTPDGISAIDPAMRIKPDLKKMKKPEQT